MDSNGLSYLDLLWQGQDAERLKQEFRFLAARDKRRALRLLNDLNLRFPTLFTLLPEIESLNLTGLSPRNAEAVRICAIKRGNPGARRRQRSNAEFEALKWMFETGCGWDGPLDEYDTYDAVIDTCAALLIRKYKYTPILPQVCDLIFRRNRNNLYIHDLVWSFFQAYDPDSLRLIARYILSYDFKDVELACKLLHLPVPDAGTDFASRQALYEDYIAWLRENNPFLLFTGEYFQQTSEPEPLVVDDEARYIGKPISPKNGKPLEPLTQKEVFALLNYRSIPSEERHLLSDYSAQIRSRDVRAWWEWLEKEPAQQVSIAMSERGEFL